MALHDLGQPTRAIETLVDAAERHPRAVDVKVALVQYLTEAGRTVEAESWNARLRTVLQQDEAHSQPR